MFIPKNEEEVEAYKAYLTSGDPGILNNVGLAIRIVSISVETIVRMSDEQRKEDIHVNAVERL